jgi:hypothetical protein
MTYVCKICNTQKKTKACYERHIALCEFTSVSAKEREQESDYSEIIPSNKDIFQIMIRLCEENAKLKKRIEYLERNNATIHKRNIDDYLLSISTCSLLYNEWIAQLTITADVFQYLLDTNLTEAIKRVLDNSINALLPENKLPIKAFSQRSNKIYICENNKWRMMVLSEIQQLVSLLCHRFQKKYMEWKTKNRENLIQSVQLRDLDIQYMQKVNGLGKTVEARSSEIVKWLFTKIKQDMKQYI